MKKLKLRMSIVFLTLISLVFLSSSLLAAGKTLRVAIVAPSASNDLAFTQSIVDGIKAIQKDRKIELAITDGTFIVEDAASAIRDYAKQGYDLVLAHGSQYGGSLKNFKTPTLTHKVEMAPVLAAPARNSVLRLTSLEPFRSLGLNYI